MRSRPASSAASCRTLGLVLVAVLAAVPGAAARAESPFNVVVNPPAAGAAPQAGQCTVVGAFGASVTVTCTPGAIRFITAPPPAATAAAQEDDVAQAGAVTTWRRITLDSGEELFEMTVRW